jgi:phage shock protein A
MYSDWEYKVLKTEVTDLEEMVKDLEDKLARAERKVKDLTTLVRLYEYASSIRYTPYSPSV